MVVWVNYFCDADSVTIHYVGKLKDGTKFDSSRDRLDFLPLVFRSVVDSGFRHFRLVPFQTEIGVGKVIRGWDEGNYCSWPRWFLWCLFLCRCDGTVSWTEGWTVHHFRLCAYILIPPNRLCLHILGRQAYGSRGFSPLIPADSDLVFDVELLKIN